MNRHSISSSLSAHGVFRTDIVGWLGVGALTVGMGAAVLAGGSGVASADGADDSTSASSSADGDGAGPRAKGTSARNNGAAHAVGHAKPSGGRSPALAARSVPAATVNGGVNRTVDAVASSPVGIANTGAATSSARSSIRLSPGPSAAVVTTKATTRSAAVTAAAVRQSPLQQLVGVVVNALVAIGGMDPVAPEPARGNLWQQGLYSVARWLADAANPGGIPKLVTSSIGTLDPETGAMTGRVLFTTAAGDAVTYRISTDPTQGSATVNPDGSFTYTPLQSTLLGAPEGGATVTVVMNAYHGVQKSSQVFNFPVTKPGNLITFNIQVGAAPAGLALTPAGNKLVVMNSGSDTISVIDTATNARTDIAVGKTPIVGAVTPDGSAVYVYNVGTDVIASSVSRVSLVNNNVVTIQFTDSYFSSVAIGPANTPAANRLYLARAGAVSMVDTSTNTLLFQTITAGQTPFGLAVSPNGQRLYVANSGDNTVSVIDTTSNGVTATIPIPIANPSGLKVLSVTATPDGKHVYVVGSGLFTPNPGPDNYVWAIDTATNTVSVPISVGSGAFLAAVSPDSSVVYVVNSGNKTVSAINTATNTILKTIAVGNVPFGIAVSSTRLYIANNGDGTVKVIPVAFL